jgi:regulator of sirC expression with transglutaminase-like and TPR domain
MKTLRLLAWPTLQLRVQPDCAPGFYAMGTVLACLLTSLRVRCSVLSQRFFSTSPALIFLVVVLGSIANAASGSEARDFSRDGFGRSELPLWSQLTPAEVEILTNRESLERGDADALLEFFLVASGDVRNTNDFARHHQQIDDWLSANARIAGIRDARKRGHQLHMAMHESFLGNRQSSDIDGYDLDQSRLSTLLDTRQYNCISSALLYLVLARKVGLQAQGVIMPSHAFVQLTLSNGEIVEVETTSHSGYDLEHDAEFYSPESGNWFADRELEMPTYADYQRRRIVSPLQLGLENMWTQHTHPSRMAYADRLRLTEVRAHFQPDDLDAQKNRLYFYTEEFSYLNKQTDWGSLQRLYASIGPWLATLDPDAADPQFANLLAWVRSGQALAALHSEQPSRGLALARSLLRDLDDRITDAEDIRSNMFFVITHYANAQIDARRFEQARAVFDGYEFACLANAACENAFARLHGDWAQHYWNRKHWEQAIGLYIAYLTLKQEGEAAQIFRSNMESAYLNWANTALHDDDWRTASQRLMQCLSQLPGAQRCKDLQRRLQEKRHLGIL